MSILKFFRRPDYNSEITDFIQGLKAAKPSLEAEQRAGRAIWWDKNLDRQAQGEWRDARVRQKPYVYQNETK